MVKRILFVDDEAMICEIYTQLLIEEEYEVVIAHDGVEALHCLATIGGIGLVVTDVGMPIMGGIEFVKICSSQYPCTPIIVCTGYVNPLLIDPLMNKLSCTIEKPIDLNHFLEVVRSIFLDSSAEKTICE